MKLNNELDNFQVAYLDGGRELELPVAEQGNMSAVIDPRHFSSVPAQQMSAIWGT